MGMKAMWEGEKKYLSLPLVHTIVTDSCAHSHSQYFFMILNFNNEQKHHSLVNRPISFPHFTLSTVEYSSEPYSAICL